MSNDFKKNNIVTVTNNNVKYYENLTNRYSKEALNSVAKAAAYANEANEYLNSCKNLKATLEEETMQLVSLHSDKTNNPHNVTAAQTGAYSKTELDSLLTTKLATKNPNLVAGQNITITANEDGTQTIKSSNTISLDYTLSQNKPSINNVTLTGNKSSHDLGLAALSDLPVNVSELQNDSGYLTQHQDITGKQDVLSAGSGIVIENNTVSTINRADTDLSNLSNTGKKVLDGQWISKSAVLSQATAVSTYNIDLSSYLPNDNYQYEVLFMVQLGNSNSTAANACLSTDIISFPTDLQMFLCNANCHYASSFITLPVGLGRYCIYDIRGHAFTPNAQRGLSALGYRRIGTNS